MEIKKEPLLIGLVIIIVVIFLYQIFVSPQGRHFKALSTQYNSQKKLLLARKEKLEVLDSLKEENQKLQEDLSSLDAKFLKRDNITSCMENLSKLTKTTGNKVIIIDPIEQEEEIVEDIIKYTVKLKLKGQYPNIIKFLNELQDQENLAVINTAEMLVAEEGAPTLETHFTITYFIYEK